MVPPKLPPKLPLAIDSGLNDIVDIRLRSGANYAWLVFKNAQFSRSVSLHPPPV
jgi:O-succinylbenzoate synthase